MGKFEYSLETVQGGVSRLTIESVPDDLINVLLSVPRPSNGWYIRTGHHTGVNEFTKTIILPANYLCNFTPTRFPSYSEEQVREALEEFKAHVEKEENVYAGFNSVDEAINATEDYLNNNRLFPNISKGFEQALERIELKGVKRIVVTRPDGNEEVIYDSSYPQPTIAKELLSFPSEGITQDEIQYLSNNSNTKSTGTFNAQEYFEQDPAEEALIKECVESIFSNDDIPYLVESGIHVTDAVRTFHSKLKELMDKDKQPSEPAPDKALSDFAAKGYDTSMYVFDVIKDIQRMLEADEPDPIITAIHILNKIELDECKTYPQLRSALFTALRLSKKGAE